MGKADVTRQAILDAATSEFATHGIAGARIDKIAQAAGYNKNLIYVYFGNKEALFTAVLQAHLLRVYEEIEFTPEDLPAYAAKVFDFATANPDLLRLMSWSSLERTTDDPAERAEVHRGKVRAIEDAQRNGMVASVFAPAELLTAIMALATAWSPANPFSPAFGPTAAQHADSLRKGVAAAVALITAP
ncbi:MULTISPECIES: TetR family transcriptional regulator [Actinomycetes]|uniref:TetR family transcriptional regulator n=1 Tax=Actinomycetes TaxID=1760 RepID=UPI0004BF709E|nr:MULTISPECIES: TetR family transcriptional regulator [Actinomycetes]